MVETGYQLLDVQYSEEYCDHPIHGAILMPLYEIPNRTDELDNKQRYIVYCRSGARSAVAALLLAQNQIYVVSLDGGIRDWPFGAISVREETAHRSRVANANWLYGVLPVQPNAGMPVLIIS
jgi:rhodanese-related sulfurtransferase